MAIIRAAHERDFTIITNAALRDTNLSLKAKGLLALMLSEHDGWNFTIKGLSAKCKEGVDAVAAIVKELETQGYVVRRRERSTAGHFAAATYTIYEMPIREAPKPEKPVLDKPAADKPSTVSPPTVKPMQRSTMVPKTIVTKPCVRKPLPSIHPIHPEPVDLPESPDGMDSMEQQESADDAGGSTDAAPIGWLDEILPIDPDEDEYMPWCWDDLEARKPFTTRQDFEDVRNLVKRQIQYDDLLKNQWKYNREQLDEIVEIMVELHTTPEAAIRISGREWPAWAIQDRLKKLTYDSLMTVYYNLDRTKNDIRNIKNYLIATLMNTPITQESQFTAEYRAHPV